MRLSETPLLHRKQSKSYARKRHRFRRKDYEYVISRMFQFEHTRSASLENYGGDSCSKHFFAEEFVVVMDLPIT